jgi:hypothetical protein
LRHFDSGTQIFGDHPLTMAKAQKYTHDTAEVAFAGAC